MNSTIIMNQSSNVVVCRVENPEVSFFGFVKSNNMTDDIRYIAEKILDTLYYVWTERYDKIISVGRDVDFRYESLIKAKMLADTLAKKMHINTDKTKLTITAVCIFSKRNKAFWINTGNDMVYVQRGIENLRSLSSHEKEEKSIFSKDEYYTEKVEGYIVRRPKSLLVVTSESVPYFCYCMRKKIVISQKTLNAFSKGKNEPIIIGEIKNN